MPKSYDVIVWGIYFCDFIYTGLPELPHLGSEIFCQSLDIRPGGCFTTVLAFHRLGVKVGWACDIGNDLLSRFVIETAEKEGLDLELFNHHHQPIRRVTTALSFPEDRAFVSYVDPFSASPIEEILEKYRPAWLLLPHLHVGQEYESLYYTAKKTGTKIFMDCQSMNLTLDSPGVEATLRAVDIFGPNQYEAMKLTETTTVTDALACLVEYTPLVVIKMGSKGAIARRGDRVVVTPSINVKVVDTTGAGDCFNAGFLYANLQNLDIEECLRIGNICGGLSTMLPGGQGAPSLDQVTSYLNNDNQNPE